MRMAMILGVFLGLLGCSNRTGIKRAGVDASPEAASETGAPTIDTGRTATEVGGPIELPDAAIAFPDAPADRIGTCVALAPSATARELSVVEALLGIENLDPAVCVPLKVKGKVFEDLREKRADSPAPVQSLFILQDSGQLPGYTVSAPRTYVQIYSVDDLSPTLHKQVHVTGHLRVLAAGTGNGKPEPFFYLEVLTITADQDPPDGSVSHADASTDGNTAVDLRTDAQVGSRETPAGGSFELRDDSPLGVGPDASPCRPGFIRTWVLEFPAGAKTVKVIPVSAVRSFPMEGDLSDIPGPILHYALKDGAGELLVWRQGDAWSAQLVVNSPGPEAGCVSGTLVLRAPM